MNRFAKPLWFIFIPCFVLSFPTNLLAQQKAGDVISTAGNVWVSSGKNNKWRKIIAGQPINTGHIIKTDRLSGASLLLQDESLIRLAQNSQFQVESIRPSSFWRKATALVKDLNSGVASTFKLLSGQLWGRNNNRDADTEISTLTATFGIRGTEYSIKADPNTSQITVHEGSVQAKNEYGKTLIHSGEQASIIAGGAPQESIKIESSESVQWTVLVPELINLPHYLKRTMQNKAMAAQIYDAYQQTQYAAANDLIMQAIQQEPNNLQLRLLNAWILIKAGESASTYAALLELSTQNPKHVPTQELTAFAALLTANSKKAKSILQAVGDQNLSDLGWVIKAYTLQLDYDLPAAERAYLKALQINPRNLSARIQLATVYFGSNKPGRANNQIMLALKQRPDYPPAVNLKGFLQLTQNATSAAITTWEKLVHNNTSNAETYFGLSLAYMRKGLVQQAMQHIATAVVLDPQRSMYLSYWGKMLHQIGRYDKALTVLGSAIRLDKQDPTPRLYRAIILRDMNRPGEAIQDIQAAVKLNDNRGVYRSRSLLDKDLAVQNVDLSRLFNQLGLADWAHKKAIHSIKSDYTNVSAHILNAGAYAAQEDRSYALANEALLARILQPANINTVSSFRGYTSLYESPDTEIDLILGAGNHDQLAFNLFAAAALPEKQLAWAITAIHDESDGWRDTNGESIDDLSLFTKWQPDQKNNFLFGISSTDLQQLDDLNPRFEVDAVSDPLARLDLTTLQLELGLHHRIDSTHDFLAYVTHLDAEGQAQDNVIDTIQTSPVNGALLGTQERIINTDFKRPHTLAQIQGIKKYNNHQIFYGLLALNGQIEARSSSDFGDFDASHTLIDPRTASDLQTSFDLDISFTSLYIQDNWLIKPSLQLELAAYLEKLDNANALTGGEWEQNETTARLGLVWNMNDQHTFRLATFEYLLPVTIARLDPTDVAGIPIFKNTNEGSLVRETDLVWDYEWKNGLISTNLFTLKENFTSATPNSQGVQVESVQKGEKQGVFININQLLNLKTGLNIGISSFDLEDKSSPSVNRDETALSVSATYVAGDGLTLSARQIRRDMNFDSTRNDETIDVTNLRLDYEFPGKRHNLSLQILNLTDEKFNWVTDDFASTGIAPERLITFQYRVNLQ